MLNREAGSTVDLAEGGNVDEGFRVPMTGEPEGAIDLVVSDPASVNVRVGVTVVEGVTSSRFAGPRPPAAAKPTRSPRQTRAFPELCASFILASLRVARSIS